MLSCDFYHFSFVADGAGACVFKCVLFNDTVNSEVYIASVANPGGRVV
jgi:hypothetical protein